MEAFIFQEAEPGGTETFGFEPSLFHDPSHLDLQRSEGWKWYFVLHPRHKMIVASLYLHIGEEVASSAIRSPFGTVECSDDLPPEILYQFLTFVETRVRATGIRKITIKNPPLHYAPEKDALLQTYLFNLGYTVIHAEVGAIRFVHEDFEKGLNRLERRKLKKSGAANLSYKLLPSDKLEEVYSFILGCRKRKGHLLSITLADLTRTILRFPDRYVLSGVFLSEEMAAASVAVRVHSNILYNFYADHAEAYDALSPVVFLVKGLSDYCLENKISMLDLGTSAENNQPNFGLLNFKMRLGGNPSPKLTFEKNLVL